MSENKRLRHTASYRLSHFLLSKESLELTWLTGNLVSILHYVYAVMDMNYNKTGKEVFDCSYAQAALYSRTSRSTIRRAFSLFLKHKLLILVHKEPRKVSQYGMGEVIQTRFTMNLEDQKLSTTRFTMNPALGSPRTQPWVHHEPLLTDDKRKIKQRERSLSLFEPDEANILLAHDLRLDLSNEVESFRNRHRGVLTQYEFGRWLKNSKEYQAKRANGHTANEVRSTVPWFNDNH